MNDRRSILIAAVHHEVEGKVATFGTGHARGVHPQVTKDHVQYFVLDHRDAVRVEPEGASEEVGIDEEHRMSVVAGPHRDRRHRAIDDAVEGCEHVAEEGEILGERPACFGEEVETAHIGG